MLPTVRWNVKHLVVYRHEDYKSQRKAGMFQLIAEHYSAASTGENVQVPALHNPTQKNDVVRGRRLDFLWRSSILGLSATKKDEEEVGFDRCSVFVIVAL